MGVLDARSADIEWITPTGGNWSVATNWSGGVVPGPADRAIIDRPGTYTVTVNVNATVAGLTLGSGTGTQTLLVNNSSRILTLDGPSAVSAGGVLRLTSGTVTGTGMLTLGSRFEWTGGTVTGSGLTVVPVGGLVALSTTGTKTLSARTLRNSGTIQIEADGDLILSGNALLDNLDTGTVEILANSDIGSSGTPRSVLRNAGTLRRSAGTGGSTVSATLENPGLVDVRTGQLVVSGGGTSLGNMTVAASATLRFPAAYTIGAAGNVTGAGTVEFTSGDVLVQGGYNVSGATTVSGSSVSFTGTVGGVGQTLSVSSGTANLGANPVTVGTLNLSGGTLAGAGTLVVNEAFNWGAGTLGGSGVARVASTATLAISGTPAKTLAGRPLDLEGSGTWSGSGTLAMNGGAVFRVRPGATLDARGDASVTTSGTPGSAVTVEGTLERSTSVGEFRIGAVLNNPGTVRVTSGTLSVNGGGEGAGRFTGAAGTTLRFGAAYTPGESSRIESEGTVDFHAGVIVVAGAYDVETTSVTGGTVTFSGPAPVLGTLLSLSSGTVNLDRHSLSVPRVSLTGSSIGSLSGTGVLTVTQLLDWGAGIQGGTGSTVVVPGAELVISGSTGKTLSGRTLSAGGSLVWSGTGTLTMNSQAAFRIETGAVAELQGGATLSSSGAPASNWVNRGTLMSATGGATFTCGAAFTQAGVVEVRSGTLRFTSALVQESGSLRLLGGALTTTSPLDLRGGELAGAGTVNGTVRNSGGFVRPAGVVSVLAAGGWTNAPGGTVRLRLGGTTPGTGHDQILTTGRAALGGTLQVELTGGHVPVLGNSYEVLRFGSSTGAFAVMGGLSPTPDVYLKPTLTSTSLVLVAIEPPRMTFNVPEVLGNGTVRLRIAEAAGFDVVIDASEDLVGWMPILTNRSSPAVLELIDADAANHAHRFYRTRLE